MELTTELSLAVLQEQGRINQSFYAEGMKEWDDTGQGCFQMFIQFYVNLRWQEMVRNN